jgi:tetratricopeptide (TPR) repeat protein
VDTWPRGRRWLEEIVTLPRAQQPTSARAKALTGAGGIAWWQEDIEAAQGFYEEALAIERQLGDPARIADALYNQAFVAAAEGDFDGAFRLFEESLVLFRRAGDESGVARADWMIVIRDLAAGNWDRPLAKAEEAGGRAPLEFLAGFLGDPEAEARAHLPQDTAQRAWDEGRTMSIDAALALVLGRDRA